MPWCNSCKHYTLGFRKRYNEHLYTTSKNFFVHPFNYIKIYYDEQYKNNVIDLIKIAEKLKNDDTIQNICKIHKNKGDITFKQQKLLVWKILNCYEPKTYDYYKEPKSLGCQIED